MIESTSCTAQEGKRLFAYYAAAYAKDMGTVERLNKVRGDYERGLMRISR